MKKLAEKRWIRALAVVLFILCTLLAIVSGSVIRIAREKRWYVAGVQDFSQTNDCESYVFDGMYYVSNAMRWLQNPHDESLGSYAGKGFSYVVYDSRGNITADTRTEKSIPVEQMEFSIPGVYSGEYTLEGYVNLPAEPYDGCYTEYITFETIFPLRYLAIAVIVISLLVAALALVIMGFGAAMLGREGKLRLTGRLPVDAVAALWLLLVLLDMRINAWITSGLYNIISAYGGYSAASVVTWHEGTFQSPFWSAVAAMSIGLCVWCICGQAAAKSLRKNLIFERLPVWIPIALCGTLNIILLTRCGLERYYYEGIGPGRHCIIMAVIDAAVMAVAIVYVLQSRVIRKSAEELAAGNLSHKTNTGKLSFVWKDIGEDLNSIGDGMSVAVEERLKSERMKTELITNVSHDLKTPLTSIINYIDLLKNNVGDEATRMEYIAILERQSAKLKKLTEDVVEASKAASGAISVQAERIDVGELLEQFLGEYSERMAQAGIEPVLSAHCEGAVIMADSTLLGRVIENLITNIIKYAMPGTRAYFELSCREEQVVIAAKNISREPLNNITASELLERFVRGDSSRHSEGSGLGLSIAQSLTELMDGKMELVVDGDLFKVELTFAPAEPETEKLPATEEDRTPAVC